MMSSSEQQPPQTFERIVTNPETGRKRCFVLTEEQNRQIINTNFSIRKIIRNACGDAELNNGGPSDPKDVKGLRVESLVTPVCDICDECSIGQIFDVDFELVNRNLQQLLDAAAAKLLGDEGKSKIKTNELCERLLEDIRSIPLKPIEVDETRVRDVVEPRRTDDGDEEAEGTDERPAKGRRPDNKGANGGRGSLPTPPPSYNPYQSIKIDGVTYPAGNLAPPAPVRSAAVAKSSGGAIPTCVKLTEAEIDQANPNKIRVVVFSEIPPPRCELMPMRALLTLRVRNRMPTARFFNVLIDKRDGYACLVSVEDYIAATALAYNAEHVLGECLPDVKGRLATQEEAANFFKDHEAACQASRPNRTSLKELEEQVRTMREKYRELMQQVEKMPRNVDENNEQLVEVDGKLAAVKEKLGAVARQEEDDAEKKEPAAQDAGDRKNAQRQLLELLKAKKRILEHRDSLVQQFTKIVTETLPKEFGSHARTVAESGQLTSPTELLEAMQKTSSSAHGVDDASGSEDKRTGCVLK